MNKYQKAFNRIDSVIGTHLVFTKFLDSKSEWGDYSHCINEIDAEFAMDADFETLQELIDKETPMRITYSKGGMEQCPNCKETDFISDRSLDMNNDYLEVVDFQYCSNCGQKLDWSK